MKKKLALCVFLPEKTMFEIAQYCDITITGELKYGRGKCPPDALLEDCKGHEMIVLGDEKVDEDVIDAWVFSGMKFIACAKGTPVTVDMKALHKYNIPLCYAPGRNAVSVAEYTLGLMLAVTRRIAITAEALRKGKFVAEPVSDVLQVPDKENVNWGPLDKSSPQLQYGLPIELYGKTLGIVGYGAIGSKVAALARCFGMEVIAYDAYCPAERMEKDGVKTVTLDDLLESSDIVSCHLPVTPETTAIIDMSWFSKMKSTAYFINTARAKVINQKDFIDAMSRKTIAGAAIDVCWQEPIPANHPLLSMEHVLITPHMAGVTAEMEDWTGRIIAKDILNYCNGRQLENTWGIK